MSIRQLTSLQNPLIKHIVKLRQNRDYRLEHQTLVISGKKLVKEISLEVPIKTLFVYDETLIPTGLKAESVFIVNEEIMQKASGLQYPEGILAEVEMPKISKLTDLKKIIVLDRVSDPGNFGTILRTALALGWDGAFILEGSCDPFNDKALSAARGATFRLPLGFGNWKDLETLIDKNGLLPLVADLEGTPVRTFEKQEKLLLVLSHEAHGASFEAIKRCQKVTIPISSQMESLNVSVAAGILMYELL